MAGFLDVIKRGVGGAGRGLAAGAKYLVTDQTPPPQPEPEPAPVQSNPRGFAMPELDPNDPDFAAKKEIHDAFQALEQHFVTEMPNIDYQGHYRKIAEELKNAPEGRVANPFSRFAIAFGTQDPDSPYDPNIGLAQLGETEKRVAGEERSRMEKTLGFKEAALEGQIKHHLANNEFKKALALAEAKARNDVTMERMKSDADLKKEEARIQGRKEVAKIQAQAALDRAERRIAAAKKTDTLKLSPTDRARMNAEIDLTQKRFSIAVAKDALTGEQPDIETILNAEDEHRRELNRIHEYYEDREIGERPPDAGPRKEPETSSSGRPSGEAWRAAGKK